MTIAGKNVRDDCATGPEKYVPGGVHEDLSPPVLWARAPRRIEDARGDQDPQMQTVISRGLRHAYRSSTRSACVLKDTRVDLRSTVQHTRCSRKYSSVPSSNDRDKTAVGVSPPRHSGSPGFF